jgi:predicted alpha/beta-hydrolase family hydrolase
MQLDVPTSVGPGRLTVAAAEHPAAVLWLGHGAGGGIDAVDLAVLASRLPAAGITVVRYEQPWRVAGKRVAARPATLDVAWQETAAAVGELAGGLPLVAGGRSAGARVACRTAGEVGAAGVVCLAFPLHPPGSLEKSRLEELLEPIVPVLVVQGGGDTFGNAQDVRAAVAAAEAEAAEAEAAEARASDRIRIVEVPGADHGMKVPKASPLGPAVVRDFITSTVAEFVLALA